VRNFVRHGGWPTKTDQHGLVLNDPKRLLAKAFGRER